MNCHGDSKNKQGGRKHSPMKHMLHMVLCCGLPLVIIGILPIITKVSPNASNVISRIVPFLCPIMMLFMLPMMMGGNKKGSCCENTNRNQDKKDSLELNKPIE